MTVWTNSGGFVKTRISDMSFLSNASRAYIENTEYKPIAFTQRKKRNATSKPKL